MLYPKPCHNEPCYKEVVAYLKIFVIFMCSSILKVLYVLQHCSVVIFILMFEVDFEVDFDGTHLHTGIYMSIEGLEPESDIICIKWV